MFDLFLITVSTVAKIVMVAALGLVTARYLSDQQRSVKGFSYITVYILLPSLLFTRLAQGLSWGVLSRYYWALLLSMVPMIVGNSFARIYRRFVDPSYHGLLMLACTFQNAVSFGLGVILNVKGLSWFSDDDADKAQAFVFLWNIMCSILLWSVGNNIIATAKADWNNLQNELQLQSTTDGGSAGDVTVANGVSCPSSSVNYDSPKKNATPVTSSPPAAATGGGSGTASFYARNIKPLMNTAILGSFAGIAVALTPPLRYLLVDSFFGDVFQGGLSLLGAGTVPMTLLMLGCNLVASSDTKPVALPRTFLAGVVFLRLVLIPSVFFAIFHGLCVLDAVPASKGFRLVMLVESCAPTAINSSVICSLHGYRAREYTRMLFVVYVCSIVSTTGWLFVYLSYLG